MSFIFRAYHAMARQRPMTTRSGLPTAAILVFVNMLRKLRDDFSPEYLAAVFDVSAPTFRKQQAEACNQERARQGEDAELRSKRNKHGGADS
jgi:DNA polymerase-1